MIINTTNHKRKASELAAAVSVNNKKPCLSSSKPLLQTHPKVSGIYHDFIKHITWVQGKPVSGLTTGFLTQTYAPWYSYEKAVYEDTHVVAPSSSIVIAKKPGYPMARWKQTPAQRMASGLSNGNRLGFFLACVIRFTTMYKLPLSLFGFHGSRNPRSGLFFSALQTKQKRIEQCQELMRSNNPGLSGMFLREVVTESLYPLLSKQYSHQRRLTQWMCDNSYIPLGAEVVVGCPVLQKGTRADLVMLHTPTKTIVVVELKTGGKSYLNKHTGNRLRAPFESATDSVFNQYMLQLGWTHHLYLRTYAGVWAVSYPDYSISPEPLLIIIDDSAVTCYPLASWFIKNQHRIFRV